MTDPEELPTGTLGICKKCDQEIEFYNSPTGTWWSHLVHPEDDHDAESKIDLLDEALEQSVWDPQSTEGLATHGLTTNISERGFEVIRDDTAGKPEFNLDMVPDGHVPRDYIMDPGTEDLIRGERLGDGMVVLIGDHMMREDPDQENLSPHQGVRLRENNRWCLVTDLRFTNRHDNSLVDFIGVYADGTKTGRRYSDSYLWLVKK